jgi:hypothetical protein
MVPLHVVRRRCHAGGHAAVRAVRVAGTAGRRSRRFPKPETDAADADLLRGCSSILSPHAVRFRGVRLRAGLCEPDDTCGVRSKRVFTRRACLSKLDGEIPRAAASSRVDGSIPTSIRSFTCVLHPCERMARRRSAGPRFSKSHAKAALKGEIWLSASAK